MHSVLHCYYEATLCSEGKDDHLGRWFSTLDFIFAKTWDSVCEFRRLDEENPRHPEYAFLAAAANSAWLKCEQYYKRADDSAAYYAAEVLQPSRKWTWLHQEWAEDVEKEPWLAVAKNAVQQLWEEEYKGKFGVPQGITLASRRLGQGTRMTNSALFRSIGRSGLLNRQPTTPTNRSLNAIPRGRQQTTRSITGTPGSFYSQIWLALPWICLHCQRQVPSASGSLAVRSC